MGRGWLTLWERYEVRDDWIDGSGSWEAANRHDFNHTITDNIWRAFVGYWNCLRTFTNATCDISTGKLLNDAGFGEISGRQSHSICNARRGTRFVTDWDSKASSTCKLFPLHIVSQAEYHIEIGFGLRHGDGSCFTGEINSQITIFDDVSRINTICEHVLLCVSFLWILLTKLWDRIIRQCVCKGLTGLVNVIDSKSSWLTNNVVFMVLPVTVKW